MVREAASPSCVRGCGTRIPAARFGNADSASHMTTASPSHSQAVEFAVAGERRSYRLPAEPCARGAYQRTHRVVHIRQLIMREPPDIE